MLALALSYLISRVKFVAKVAKIMGYQRLSYLLVFCRHKINTFYPAY